MADKLTLQHFKDEVAKEIIGKTWEDYVKFYKPGYPLMDFHNAWERYAQYLAGEAWEEGWGAGWESDTSPNPYKQKEA